MNTSGFRQRFLGGLIALIVLSLVAIPATAEHSWGSYHWARTSNPFTLKLGDNMTTSTWDSHLGVASSDWSTSSVLNTTVVSGAAKSAKTCKAVKGRIEVCNAAYGNNGWLGVAQIWVSGSHITQATAKQNDTYFSRAPYNTAEWRQYVLCQEVGHTFGLDHIDENYDTTDETCMDYNDFPELSQHPYQHDYDQLETIYSHTDSTTTIGASTTDRGAAVDDIGNDPSNWGQVVRRDAQGRPSLYRKDLGRNEKVFTFVIYADEAQDPTVNDGKKDGGKKKADSKRDGGKKADRKKDGKRGR